MRICVAALAIGACWSACGGEQLECRVRQTSGGPRIFVDGKAVPPRFFYGDDGMGPLGLSPEWKSYAVSFRPDGDVAKGTVHFRFPHETGFAEIRSLRVTASDGSSVAQTWQRYPTASRQGHLAGDFAPAADGSVGFRAEFAAPNEEDGRKEDDFHVYLAPQPMKAGVDYRVTFEARAGGDIARTRVMAYEIVDGFRHLNMPASDGGSLVRQAKMAASAGVDFVTFHVRSLWPEDGGEEDFTALDRTCDDLIAANPHVRLVPRIRIEASFAWFEKHPELRETYEGGKQAKVSGCVADPGYRAQMKRHAERVCRHLMTRYPRHFAGIHICALSAGGEWFYEDPWTGLGGNDPATLRAFRQYLAARGVADADTAEIPTVEERKRSAGVGGSRLLDPVRDARLLQFNRFRQNLAADTLAEMAAACRAATEGRKLVVAFYGYTFEFAQNWSGPANTGNYALGRLLKTAKDDLDILCGPGSYFDRQWAQGAPVMSAAETIQRAGILWLNEDDSSTYFDFTHGRKSEGCKMTLGQNLEMLRRNETKVGMQGYGSWWMDLFGAGWYQDEKLWAVRRELTPFAEEMCRLEKPFAPEVAAIVDEESMLCGIWASRETLYPLVSNTRAGLARTGAPFGQYLLSDVVSRPLDARLQVFLAAWYLPKARRDAVVSRIRRGKTVRVWCWAPGWLDEGGANEANVEKLTGFRVRLVPDKVKPLFAVDDVRTDDEVWERHPDGSPAVVVRRQADGGADVFVARPVSLPAALLARCAQLAGVHLYVPPDTATMWAAGDYLSVQAVRDADFNVTWPDGTTRRLSLRKGECRLLKK